MKIRKKFLKLTKITFPYGTERFLRGHLPNGVKMDKFGNYYISIGENYTTMFTCHLDTACKKMTRVNHKFSENYIMTDGTTILGADDKAGMVVILYMIEKAIPGLYYFFIGEESGCIGSSNLSSEIEKSGDFPIEFNNIKKVVSFDRRGTSSVITDQLYGTCCSDKFAESLCDELNEAGFGLSMKPDDGGIMTDSAQFMGIVPECTNISVGYYDEHTTKERQDIDHLYRLCQSVVSVNWESLPVERTPVCNFYNDWDDWDEIEYIKPHDYSKDFYTFIKDEFGVRKLAYVSKTWINHETLLISEMFRKQGRSVEVIEWDGSSLWVKENGFSTYIGNRSDLVEIIGDMSFCIPDSHLKYSL
jgi:hypothetical protein